MSRPVSAPRRVYDDDALSHAMNRAVGSRPIAGNAVQLYADSALALRAMLAMIAGARRRVHLENYIIRDDRTGTQFADALIERAGDGVKVRVLYDAVGCRGTSGRYWQRLRRAGVDIRAFHPVTPLRPLEFFSRDHRKLLVADGASAMLGGLCIGDEWAGDPERGRQAWRDTMVSLEGPAALALDHSFARTWERAGAPLPAADVASGGESRGRSAVRVIEGTPGRLRIFRAAQLTCAAALQRIWVTDAYLVAPPALRAEFLDAAREGVDVRLLVPGISDAPILRTLTRIGYREMLEAGVRIYEWRGPMLHAKCMVVDRRWARVGSSNLNYSSLLANYELDILVESDALCDELADQFRRDIARSREVVLRPRRLLARRRLAAEPGSPAASGADAPHRPSLYERQINAAVALRRVAGGLRQRLAASAAALLVLLGVLVLAFPRATSAVLALVAFWLALVLGLKAIRRRHVREAGDDEEP